MRLKNKLMILSITLTTFLLTTPWSYAQKTESTGWHVKGYTEETAKKYFDRRYSLDIIEGIWQSNDGFKYSVERDVENGTRIPDKYRMIILESSHNGWSATQIKGFVTYSSVNGVYSLKYYTRDEKGGNLESQNVIMIVESPILVSFTRMDGKKIQLIKLYPKIGEDESHSSLGAISVEKQWSGSSVVIGDRYLATNNHVVEGARSLVISGSINNYNKDYSVEVIAVDKNVDLAILKVNDPDFEGFGLPVYGISTTTSDVGTDVFVLGYPMTTVMGQEIKLTTGIISSKTGYQGDPAMYQISAAVQPGNSGGPLFDGEGNLIGIVVAKITQADNVSYAIKLNYLRSLVESCSERISFDYMNRIINLPLTEKIKKISPFVYFVKANTASKNFAHNDRANSTETVQQGADVARDYLRAANQMIEEEKYEEAFDLVKKSVEACAGKENHYLRAILALERFSDYDLAVESAKYCLDHKYYVSQCTQILAKSYYAQEKWEESINMWNIILSEDRKNILAYYWRGHSYRRLGDTENALKDFNAALKFEGITEGNYAQFYNDIAYIYMDKGDLLTAERYLDKALERGHASGNYIDSYGELMYKKGNYKECLRYMGASIAQGKKVDGSWLGNSYYYRGLANLALGYGLDAYDDLNKAVEFHKKEAKEALQKLETNNNRKSGKYFNIYRTPSIREDNDKSLLITAIEITEESTVIYFNYNAIGAGGVGISADTYIIEKGSNNKLYLIGVDGIAVQPQYTSYKNNTVAFTLTFPPIGEGCNEIDFVEVAERGWIKRGILLKDNYGVSLQESIKPEDVYLSRDPKDAEGLVAVKTITKKSGWGGPGGAELGFKNCAKAIMQEAAKQGCCMAIIIEEDYSFASYITATIYKRP